MVASAETAAPFFFKPVKVERNTEEGTDEVLFTDGGFGKSNNPTKQGIREIEELYGYGTVNVVVSVGTSRADAIGGTGFKQRIKDIADNATDPEEVHWEIVDDILTRKREKGERAPFNYYRFNDPGALKGINLDEWQPRGLFARDPGSDTLVKMKVEFGKYSGRIDVARQFEECARLLVQQRQERTELVWKWERFATGIEFACPRAGCDKSTAFKYRNKFKRHLLTKHNGLDMDEEALDQEIDNYALRWRYKAPKEG